MDTKFSIPNDVEEEMGIIHEESSDEDNSSKEGNLSDKDGSGSTRMKEINQRFKMKEVNYETGEISEIKSKDNSTKVIDTLKRERSGKNLLSEKLSKQHSDFAEEEKFHHSGHKNLFHDFRDSFDRTRDQRSNSCKSAAASLQFSNNRFFRKKLGTSPFKALPKRSYKFSSSTSKRKTHVSSFAGVAGGKTSEPSLVDMRKQIETHSKCLSEISNKISRRRSETRKSMPIDRCPSNSSLSSEYSARIGNTSTTTFTSDITWEFRSCKLQPLDPRYRSRPMEAEFPYISTARPNRAKVMRQFSRVGETLPELIE